MACNCATTEQIDALYKKYSERSDKSGVTFWQKVKNFFTKIGIAFCMIFIAPYIFFYVLYKAFGSKDHKIDITKFLNIKHKPIGANVG